MRINDSCIHVRSLVLLSAVAVGRSIGRLDLRTPMANDIDKRKLIWYLLSQSTICHLHRRVGHASRIFA